MTTLLGHGTNTTLSSSTVPAASVWDVRETPQVVLFATNVRTLGCNAGRRDSAGSDRISELGIDTSFELPGESIRTWCAGAVAGFIVLASLVFGLEADQTVDSHDQSASTVVATG